MPCHVRVWHLMRASAHVSHGLSGYGMNAAWNTKKTVTQRNCRAQNSNTSHPAARVCRDGRNGRRELTVGGKALRDGSANIGGRAWELFKIFARARVSVAVGWVHRMHTVCVHLMVQVVTHRLTPVSRHAADILCRHHGEGGKILKTTFYRNECAGFLIPTRVAF